MMKAFIAGLVVFLGILALVAGISLLLTFPVMWAMNYTFSATFLTLIFGVSKMTFWKTFVANLLIGWLFKASYSSGKKG